MTQWQPIESAPINKIILLWAGWMDDLPEFGEVDRNGIVWHSEEGRPSRVSGVTHWMPLPEPPAD